MMESCTFQESGDAFRIRSIDKNVSLHCGFQGAELFGEVQLGAPKELYGF
jgi:hypothetical protein